MPEQKFRTTLNNLSPERLGLHIEMVSNVQLMPKGTGSTCNLEFYKLKVHLPLTMGIYIKINLSVCSVSLF